MGRTRPPERLDQLVETATGVFIASGGFQRTQIGDIARALGVAKGTVYLYVESKEALFDLVMRRALGLGERDPELPVPTPAAGATLELVAGEIRRGGAFPALEAALSRRRADDVGAELDRVLREIFDVLATNRTAIKLIGASAHDIPELAHAWYGDGRARLNRRLTEYLGSRAAAGQLAPGVHTPVAARLVTETLTWFAVHRHWDPAPDEMNDDDARDTAVAVLVRGLAGGPG